jgi:hypothetical protein
MQNNEMQNNEISITELATLNLEKDLQIQRLRRALQQCQQENERLQGQVEQLEKAREVRGAKKE